MLTPIIILGGISIGFFTPTEAAAVAAIYAFILGKFVYRIMTWKDVAKALLDTAILTGVVVFIMAMAALWSWMITNEEIANMAVEFLTSVSNNQAVMLLMLNIILLGLGYVHRTFGHHDHGASRCCFPSFTPIRFQHCITGWS